MKIFLYSVKSNRSTWNDVFIFGINGMIIHVYFKRKRKKFLIIVLDVLVFIKT